MVKLEVTIELAGPLLVGSKKLGTVYETLDYLPGSVLRGVVAETLMHEWPLDRRRIPHPDKCPDRASCTFCQLFYPETGPQPRFGNCYPAVEWSFPLPATARTCKDRPGFRRDEYDPNERHGIFDILIRQVAFEEALRSKKPLPYIYQPRCPRCGAKVEPQSGFYALLGDRFHAPRTLPHRLSRTAISRRRGSAEEEMLYTLGVLGERMDIDFLEDNGTPVKQVTTLRGAVWVSEEGVKWMKEALTQLERLGGARSRGLGKVASIKIEPVVESEVAFGLFLDRVEVGDFALPPKFQQREDLDEPLRPEGIGERLLCFNYRIQAEQAFYAKLGVPVFDKRWYFSLDLISDAILHDDGLPTLHLTPEAAGLGGEGLPKVQLERCFVRRGYRSGWSGAYGLPREVKLAVTMGSVYLYSVEAAGREENERLLEALHRLETDGIGGERERGFGHLLVCSPFHLEVKAR